MSDKLEKIQQLMPLGKMQEVNAWWRVPCRRDIATGNIEGWITGGHGYRSKEMAEGTAFIPEV
mgnify:CR=1 FL=1